MNLTNLKNNKTEILKAEIGTLLFNLGKTHAGIGNWKNYFPDITQLFSSYKNYYKNGHFENELQNIDDKLKNFFLTNHKIKLPDNSQLDFKEFIFGGVSGENFIKKVFFRGCENINSVIDKGSPKDDNQIKGKLYLSNAFGSFKREIKENYFDKTRLCFFDRLHRFLDDKGYYATPDWISINIWIKNEIKNWYSRLLSDSRFPINDVSLWEQAYMTASMFKATLVGLYFDNSNFQNFIDNPQSIRWSILGIQYDKLSLAEKGLKPGFIAWYRETVKKVDDEIKKLLEIEYPIGNEVYRDETGIYFIVGENLKGDVSGDFYKLSNDLKELKDKIIEIFDNNFQGEVYPAIFLTEPSRGLMNLGHLVDKAKENFLKAEIPRDFKDKLKHDENPQSICQVCRLRLAYKYYEKNGKKIEKDKRICDICFERNTGRLKKWLKNRNDETIWTGELQNKNGRIALITLKFEIEKWLNGDLVNSLMVRNENFKNVLESLKRILRNFDDIKDFYSNNKNDMNQFVRLFDKMGIQHPFNSVLKDNTLKKILGQPNNNLKEHEKSLKSLFWRCIEITMMLLSKQISDFNNYLTINFSNPNYDNKEKRYRNNSFVQNNSALSYFKDVFSVGFIYLQIKNLVLERSIGDEWEKFIKDNLSKGSAIDFNNRKINWEQLTDSDIEFLSTLILQFLLRKNPSPVRLKRIWETTKEFFEEISTNIETLLQIDKKRKERYFWENVDIENGKYKDGEFEFWADNQIVYLIISTEKVIDKKEFNLKTHQNNQRTNIILKIEDAKVESYKSVLSIIDPTPVSYQFIIPTDRIPILLKKLKEEYNIHFKYVYGKLPLHIGIIVQDYKKPLYAGIKALRKIRRDKIKWTELQNKINTKYLKTKQKEAFYYATEEEQANKTEDFYSYYEVKNKTDSYEFYIYPENKQVWIDTTQNLSDNDEVFFYPNTFDFEFMDANTRRNDVFYKKAKRFIKLKKNRPYYLDDFQYFEKFKEFFYDKKTSSKLQKLISVIYSKLEDWKNDNEAIKQFMLSAFINILELKNEIEKDNFAQILKLNTWEDLKQLEENQFTEKLYLILDMFEFWHKMLKEV